MVCAGGININIKYIYLSFIKLKLKNNCTGFFFIYLVEEVVGTFLVAPFKTEHDCCKGKDDCHSDMEMTNNSPSPSASDIVSDGSYRKTAAFRDFFTSKSEMLINPVLSVSLS